jgi:hypothetical protein
MNGPDTFGYVLERLRTSRIPHMLAGSFASTYHGTPRTTQDIDIVIDPTASTLRDFVASLPRDAFYVDRDAALDALTRRTQFNVIDVRTGWKVDLIIRKDRPFSVEEFRRRRPATILGHAVDVASAEDTIVAKLEWARLGESDRQVRDVAGIVRVLGSSLDLPYVERWVGELGLSDLWQVALRAATE